MFPKYRIVEKTQGYHSEYYPQVRVEGFMLWRYLVMKDGVATPVGWRHRISYQYRFSAQNVIKLHQRQTQ